MHEPTHESNDDKLEEDAVVSSDCIEIDFVERDFAENDMFSDAELSDCKRERTCGVECHGSMDAMRVQNE